MSQAILLGGGYSVKEGIQKGLWDKIKDKDTWSCNSMFLIMPYLPKHQVWVDNVFTQHEFDTGRLQDLQKQGVELITKNYHRLAYLQDQIVQYGTTREKANYYGRKAIEENLIYYGRMGLCGQFALSVAVGRGYDEIFMLGYDFGPTSLNDHNTHVYQDEIAKQNILCTGARRPEVYWDKQRGDKLRIELDDWDVYLKEKDLKLWNVSVNSNLPYYQKITYEEFFKLLK